MPPLLLCVTLVAVRRDCGRVSNVNVLILAVDLYKATKDER